MRLPRPGRAPALPLSDTVHQGYSVSCQEFGKLVRLPVQDPICDHLCRAFRT